MIDRTTKVLLGAIALGLWANAGVPLLRTTPAYAAADVQLLSGIDEKLEAMLAGIMGLYRGKCPNKNLCPLPY